MMFREGNQRRGGVRLLQPVISPAKGRSPKGEPV